MFRYSPESANTSSGVFIRRSSASQPDRPAIMSAPQSAALAMQAVDTAVFIPPYSPAPKSRETTTEQPILQPNAKAMKISVTS